MKNNRGFTLIELSVVLFVLGLILWLAAPRLASVGEPDRNGVFRGMAAGSEEAFDLALFEKRETRLVLDPAAGTYRFQVAGDKREASPKPMGGRLTITGIRIENEERPLDLVTEIRYLPGGRVSAARIFIRDAGSEGEPTEWTLKINPFDGSVDVLPGTVVQDA
jgi:prepilin-type N-terminal cleavage/methylation domain-containing protein